MKRLEFDEKNNLADVLKAIKKEPDSDLEIFIFPGNEILKDSANRAVIELLAKDLNKKVVLKGEEGTKQVAEESVAGTKEKKEDNLGFIEGKDVAEEQEVVEEKPREKKWWSSLSKFTKLKFLKGPRWIYFLAGFFGLLFISGSLFFWFVPSATVTLTTEQKSKESELTLIASAEAEEIDTEKGIIPLETLDTTLEDVLETNATGTKTVGTAAKGRVKIVNRDTENAKTFFKGTSITSVSGSKVNFTLDTIATVSAAPVGCEADCPQTGVDVTAKSIGEAGNLKAGTVFRIGSANVNLVFAKSETNFSGGTSKKLTVVSSDDRRKGKKKLIEKMEKKAKEELAKDDPDIVIPEGGLESEVLNETYTRKVGEEASDFRLSLEIKFTAKIFSEEDLKNLLISSISSTIPSGFEIDRDNSIVEGEILEKTDEDLKVLGSIKASLLPTIDADEVTRNISGKDFGATDKYLKSLDSIEGFEINLSPSIFRIFGTMPFSRSRIKIEVIQKE
jgi:hypothetical protein